MPATRKQIDANRRNGHLRRAARHYQRATDALTNARTDREHGRLASAHTWAKIARGWGRAARIALRIAAKYEGR